MNQLKAIILTPIRSRILPKSKSVCYFCWAISDNSEVASINTFEPKESVKLDRLGSYILANTLITTGGNSLSVKILDQSLDLPSNLLSMLLCCTPVWDPGGIFTNPPQVQSGPMSGHAIGQNDVIDTSRDPKQSKQTAPHSS